MKKRRRHEKKNIKSFLPSLVLLIGGSNFFLLLSDDWDLHNPHSTTSSVILLHSFTSITYFYLFLLCCYFHFSHSSPFVQFLFHRMSRVVWSGGDGVECTILSRERIWKKAEKKGKRAAKAQYWPRKTFSLMEISFLFFLLTPSTDSSIKDERRRRFSLLLGILETARLSLILRKFLPTWEDDDGEWKGKRKNWKHFIHDDDDVECGVWRRAKELRLLLLLLLRKRGISSRVADDEEKKGKEKWKGKTIFPWNLKWKFLVHVHLLFGSRENRIIFVSSSFHPLYFYPSTLVSFFLHRDELEI